MIPSQNFEWSEANVVEKTNLGERLVGLRLCVPGWVTHTPGQYIDVRIKTQKGYNAVKQYSISSPPHDQSVELCVEIFENGEVSPILRDLNIGNKLDVRGPLGVHFVWDGSASEPVVAIAGGTGITPFVSMLRHYEHRALRQDFFLFASAQNQKKLPYISEIMSLAKKATAVTFVPVMTRDSTWDGPKGRIDAVLLRQILKLKNPLVYICGSTSFVEHVVGLVVKFGFSQNNIRTEFFI